MVTTRREGQKPLENKQRNGTRGISNVKIKKRSKESEAKNAGPKLKDEAEESKANGNVEHTGEPEETEIVVEEANTRQDMESVIGTRDTPILGQQKHKRFGDDGFLAGEESNGVKGGAGLEGVRDIVDNENAVRDAQRSESDDDAPEEVTVAAGESQLKAATTAIAQALRKQAEQKKTRRRKRDQDLKNQAKSSKKRKAAELKSQDGVLSDTSNPPKLNSPSGDIKNLARTLLQSEGPLPAFLPDEILAVETEPEPRAPVSAIIQSKRMKPANLAKEERNKRKRLDAELQTPKDIKQGNTRVRVLPQFSPALPPPVVKATANIKERWRKDGMKRVKVPGYRQSGAKSFLRK